METTKANERLYRHPIQPLGRDRNGVVRFRQNAIVAFLLDEGPFDMNDIARRNFSNEDQEQFAQLIGYSLSGFGELSYVSEETYEAAARMEAEGVTEEQARIATLRETLERVRKGLRIAVPALFHIHPDDIADDAD